MNVPRSSSASLLAASLALAAGAGVFGNSRPNCGKPRMPSSRAMPPNNLGGKSGNPRPQWGLRGYPCPPVQPAVPSRQVRRAHTRVTKKVENAKKRFSAMEARAHRAMQREEERLANRLAAEAPITMVDEALDLDARAIAQLEQQFAVKENP